MRKLLNVGILFVVGALATACSSSQKNETELEDAFGVAADTGGAPAQTDQVPVEVVEEPQQNVVQAPGSTIEPADTAAPGVLDPVAPPMSGDFEQYSVRRGDTLMKIAFEHYGDIYAWRKILEMNRDSISDPSALTAGTQLKIEKPSSPVVLERNGEKYLIHPGDTLGVISNQVYGTPKKWRKIWDNNRQLIKDPNKIYAGFYLYYVPENGMGGAEPQPLAGAAGTQPQGAAGSADLGSVSIGGSSDARTPATGQ